MPLKRHPARQKNLPQNPKRILGEVLIFSRAWKALREGKSDDALQARLQMWEGGVFTAFITSPSPPIRAVMAPT